MIRPTSLILMVLAAAAGGALFPVSFEVGALDDRLAQLNRQIRDDREAIHVLRAEWSFLNQPARLEELARRHLDLKPVAGAQIAGTGAIPVRAVATPSEAADGSEPSATAIVRVAAPRAKPAIPDLRPTYSAPPPAARADLVRTLDDVLRDVTEAQGAGAVR
jgi:hypothetical protein